ncbi:TPA: ankyrin repeat domain-containing protein [Stenotrophomonas maltophilia]|nr:ankyrin repeat domain-containing protein [Stenotrophomonas maltophilia]
MSRPTAITPVDILVNHIFSGAIGKDEIEHEWDRICDHYIATGLASAVDGEGNHLLHILAPSNQGQAIQRCINAGVDINLQAEWSNATPLHTALSVGADQAVEVLVAAGADLTLRDCIGNTPLHTAAMWGDKKTVALLVQAGADACARNGDDMTPSETSMHASISAYLEHAQAQQQRDRLAQAVAAEDRPISTRRRM